MESGSEKHNNRHKLDKVAWRTSRVGEKGRVGCRRYAVVRRKPYFPFLAVRTGRGLAERGFDVLYGVLRNVYGILHGLVTGVMVGDKPIQGLYLTCVARAATAHDHVKTQAYPLPKRQLAIEPLRDELCGFFTR